VTVPFQVALTMSRVIDSAMCHTKDLTCGKKEFEKKNKKNEIN